MSIKQRLEKLEKNFNYTVFKVHFKDNITDCVRLSSLVEYTANNRITDFKTIKSSNPINDDKITALIKAIIQV